MDDPAERAIPDCCTRFVQRLKNDGYLNNDFEPDQLTVNVYSPGDGIPPHVDTHSAFSETILCVSLESSIMMDFFQEGKEECSVVLPSRSVLVLEGETRYGWMHSIAARVYDPIPMNGDYRIIPRKRRTSFTFRQIRKHNEPCCCQYARLCDSQQLNVGERKNINELNDCDASLLERLHVHKVYEEIADHFSSTRHSPWPKVKKFVEELRPGSLVLDVGCGNGKYMAVNSNIFTIGCDRSESLLGICVERGYTGRVVRCDGLQLGFRDAIFDAVVCIAVVHHFTTPERRLNAIRELIRVLKPNDGVLLVYVWAKNQRQSVTPSTYVANNKVSPDIKSRGIDQHATVQLASTEVSLPIHVNRTDFSGGDLFVPWKKTKQDAGGKMNNQYHRFYHVFEKNELSALVNSIKEAQVTDEYYDEGNWCIIARRKL